VLHSSFLALLLPATPPFAARRNLSDCLIHSRYIHCVSPLGAIGCITLIFLTGIVEQEASEDNKWNVPDWRDESQYPIPLPEKDHSDLLQWRWEFLRRDKEYREDWSRLREKDPEEQFALVNDPIKPIYGLEIPVLVKEQCKDPYYFQKKYKLKKLFNPAYRKPRYLAFYPFSKNSISLNFDLDKPVSNEIRRAEAVLKKAHKERHGRILRATYPDKKKWALFLRAIDAEDRDGLSLHEISYQLLSMDRTRHSKRQATSYAESFLGIGRSFWKDLPIPLK
jgi:hypothetical protein